MLHIESTLVLVIIVTGLYFRHRRPDLHIRLMTCAFLLDLALVIYIEASRHAVEKVATHVRPMVFFHAMISLGVLVTYVVMIILGRRVLQGGPAASRTTHRNMGIVFTVLRSLNYVTAIIM